jgi:hypothetical protein
VIPKILVGFNQPHFLTVDNLASILMPRKRLKKSRAACVLLMGCLTDVFAKKLFEHTNIPVVGINCKIGIPPIIEFIKGWFKQNDPADITLRFVS